MESSTNKSTEPLPNTSASSPVSSDRQAMISLRQVHRFFGATRAVDNVSFDVQRGEVFGFIGPNGAGKTTTMRILSTLDMPTQGDAFVDGFSVVYDPDRVRRRLGFMPDYFGTYSNMDCYEYLDFFARSYGLIGRERQQAIQRVMGFTGLEKLRYKPTSGLSKGMKQRLCLGRSMIHDPAVLILDEPAAGLDPRARIELRLMIRELAANDKTLLVSSHILTELAEMCDRVGIIEQGRLLAVGTVEEIERGQVDHLQVQIRVISRVGELRTWLTQQSTINHVEVDGELLHFVFAGDRTAQAQLLRTLVEAGFEIAEFTTRSKSLEDVFMHVTEGLVQ